MAPLKLKFFSFINVLNVVDIPSIGQLGIAVVCKEYGFIESMFMLM
jgi:hypothetical protein